MSEPALRTGRYSEIEPRTVPASRRRFERSIEYGVG